MTLRTRVAVLAIGACVAGTSAAASAATSRVGIVPPRHPASDCPVSVGGDPLGAIDRCRSREGVGPMHLPSNWGRLSAVEQTFVAIDLERVNRGLKPIAGLTRALNALAQKGANVGEDPPFPTDMSKLRGSGSIWSEGGSPVSAIFYWMYKDGPGHINVRCPPTGGRDCWGHRDAILTGGSSLISGGGHTVSNTTFEIISVSPSSERSSSFVFTWSSELRFFAQAPGSEPKQG